MNIWQNITSIVNNNLEFTKIKYRKVTDDAKGYIYFDDGQGADCFIDMAIRYLYYLREPTEEYYTSYPLSNGQVVELDTPMRISTYTKLDAVNNYLFWADDPDYEAPPEGEDNVPTEDTIIKISSTELRLREKEQVRPTDQTQEWTDTGNFRDDSEYDVKKDDCSCGILFRWVSVGNICDGANLCDKLQFQRKIDCNSEWEVYQPEIYKVGEVIEYDSGICGTHEYKEDWLNDLFCGSYLNSEYSNDYVPTSKYKIKVPFIKKKTDKEWTQLNCKTIIDLELIKNNSFECGWESTKETYEYDNDLCGNVAMEKYPKLTGLTSTNKYNVTITHHWKTEPYPTNTDDMTEDKWVWTETATTYSTTLAETDSCDCGYYYLQFDATEEYACGSELDIGLNNVLYITNYNNGVISDAYINTNIPITDDLYYRIKYRVRYGSGGIFIGDIDSPSDDNDYRLFFLSNYGYLDMESRRLSATTFGGTSKTYEMEIGTTYVKNLSTNSITGSTSYTIADRNRPLYIYAPSNHDCDGVDIYYFKIYNSSGLIRDFIPYEQNGVVGLYDNVEKKFYSSDGNGQFVARYNTYDIRTTQYRKYIENKYCGGVLLEPTGVEKWVVYDETSCECGYRVTSSTTEYDYTYVCGDTLGDGYDNGYMYYKKIVKTYRQCVDGSNQELTNTQESYLKATHSESSVTTCVLNEEYNAYIDKLVTTYRTYYDENDKAYKLVECGGSNIVTNTSLTVKSKDCGWSEKWAVSGSVCCGNLELEPAIFTITETSGNWKRNNNQFTSNAISHSKSTTQTIKFTLSKDAKIDLKYNISSEGNYDKFYYSEIDGTSATLGEISGVKTGTVTFDTTAGEHSIILKYSKDGSNSSGRDNVIVTLGIADKQCNEYGKYNLEVYRYSTDSGNTWVTKVPEEYRYGSIIESKSEECGYIPRLEHWVLVCPDITYDTAQNGDECTICSTYNGAPTMFAIEKKQYSIDGGKTWTDVTPLQTRTERILKWKADKCGYTGDTFEYRWTDTYCNGKNLMGTRTTFVSSDNGKTWSEVEGTSIIALKEENSSECQGEGTA